MRTLKNIAILALVSLMTVSCYNEIENELAAVERRISNLEQRLNNINTNIISLQTIADRYKSYIYVTSYRPVYEGKDVLGYVINLSDGSSVTLNNGVSKDDPIVGLQLGEDGLYYWIVTVNGVTDFFYDEVGQKITASVASPIMKIVDGVWKVSFDNGYVWQTFDKATGEDGRSYVDSIVTRGDYINIYLISGQTVKFPTYSLYENYLAQLNSLNVNMDALSAIYRAKADQTYVQTVVPIEQEGVAVGYTMVFSDGREITVYNGKRHEGQQIGLVQHSDGEYYWAVYENGNYRWLYDDQGAMVKASPTEGISPIFMLDDSAGDGKYYWLYKYGETGTLHYLLDENGHRVAASGSGIVQVFSSVEVTANYVLFKTLSGTPFAVPRYQRFNVTFSRTTVAVPVSPGSAAITYTVSQVPSTVAVTAITDQGYYATLTKSYNATNSTLTGTITLTADETAFSTSNVLILVSDGKGHLETFTIRATKQ